MPDRADRWLFASLLAVPLLWLFPVLFLGQALIPVPFLQDLAPWRPPGGALDAHWNPLIWDAAAFFAPARLFAHDTIRAGHWPLWNPYALGGTPFLADAQSAVLYPPNILFWILPPVRAFGVSAMMHLFLAGAFLACWLRRDGVSPGGAGLAAIALQIGGWATAWLELPNFLATACWLPLILTLMRAGIDRPRRRRAAALAVATALTLLGGHLQIAFYCLLAAILYALHLAFEARADRPRCRAFCAMAATGLTVGVLLAAVQLLPTADLARQGHRQIVPTAAAYAGFAAQGLPPGRLATLAIPDLLGNPSRGTGSPLFSEYAAYVGVLPLLLALAMLPVVRRDARVRFLAGWSALSLGLALGTPLNVPFYFLAPGFAQFGSPGRALVGCAFAVPALAALGFDAWHAGRLPVRRLWGASAVLVLGTGILALSAPAFLPGLQLADLWAVSATAVRAFAGLVIVAALLLAARSTGRISPGFAAITAVLITVADLAAANAGYNPTGPADAVFGRTALTDRLAALCRRSNALDERVLVVNPEWPLHRPPHAVLPPNTPGVYNLADTGGYDPLYLRSTKDWLDTAQISDGVSTRRRSDSSPPTNGNLVMPWYSPAIVRGFAVAAVLAAAPLAPPGQAPPGLRPPAIIDGAWLYPVTSPEPRLRFSGGRATVVPESGPNTITVRVAGPGRLLVRDVLAPGWEAIAYPDGRRLPIVAAEGLFRQVEVMPGESSVSFRYAPAGFRLGLFVSLAAALMTGLLSWRSEKTIHESGLRVRAVGNNQD